MLQGIVRFSLRFRGIIVALACVVVGYGVYVASHAKLDVFPNFVPPQVVVQTEAPGLSPEQVEVLVTRPIESTINGLGNMASLRSESIPGLSVITAVFKEGTDIFIARQMLAEKLGETAGELPAGVKTPMMSPLTSATMDLLKIGLVSKKLSPMELRTLADWTIKKAALSPRCGALHRFRRGGATASNSGSSRASDGVWTFNFRCAGGGACLNCSTGSGLRGKREPTSPNSDRGPIPDR